MSFDFWSRLMSEIAELKKQIESMKYRRSNTAKKLRAKIKEQEQIIEVLSDGLIANQDSKNIDVIATARPTEKQRDLLAELREAGYIVAFQKQNIFQRKKIREFDVSPQIEKSIRELVRLCLKYRTSTDGKHFIPFLTSAQFEAPLTLQCMYGCSMNYINTIVREELISLSNK